jgi:RND family efflux transporter MFP subunit
MPVQIEPVRSLPLRDASDYVAILKSQQSVQVQPLVEGHVTRILVASGDRVPSGKVLMEIDPSRQRATVNSQRAVHEANRANLEFQRKQFERVQRLYSAGAATRQDFDQAQTALHQAEATLASTESQVKAGVVELRYYRVVAPSAGVVGDIPVRVGDLVTPQSLLTTLDENQILEAYVDVPLERAAGATLGTPVEIVDETGKVLASSTITFISPRADPATQTVLVKSRFDNTGGRLRAAQFARARVIWSEHQGPVVPVLAVQSLNGQPFVWVVRPGANGGLTAAPRPVQVGAIQGQGYPVLRGLQPGEKIVVSGVQKLRPGAPVVPAAAGGGGAGTGAGTGGEKKGG